MPPAHRHGDKRVCDASTVVIGQSSVFVNDVLWAVDGDINDHGNGQLIPSVTDVFVEDKLVIVHPDTAMPDDLCLPVGLLHCMPDTASASGDVFAGG